jgi:hypothetical protein
MKIIPESHLDHHLTADQRAYIEHHFADRNAFFIEQLELPAELGTVPCGLHGPKMGDAPLNDIECRMAPRGQRPYYSRVCSRALRPVNYVTVIAGPHDVTCPVCHGDQMTCLVCEGAKTIQHKCVLFTAFGGPIAPREPGDLVRVDAATVPAAAGEAESEVLIASRAFWAQHALSEDS